MKWTSKVRGSTSADTDLPLTVIVSSIRDTLAVISLDPISGISADEEEVWKAVFPRLARFDRLDEGVAVLLPMPSSVTVLRVVTTSDLTSDQTGPEMDPRVTRGHTLLAHIGSGSSLSL